MSHTGSHYECGLHTTAATPSHVYDVVVDRLRLDVKDAIRAAAAAAAYPVHLDHLAGVEHPADVQPELLVPTARPRGLHLRLPPVAPLSDEHDRGGLRLDAVDVLARAHLRHGRGATYAVAQRRAHLRVGANGALGGVVRLLRRCRGGAHLLLQRPRDVVDHSLEHPAAEPVPKQLLAHIVVDDLVRLLLPLGDRVLLLGLLHRLERVELVEKVSVVGGADGGRDASAAAVSSGDVSANDSANVPTARERFAEGRRA
mmetsp:Transcript_3039/g.11321  ORF Transcript_3039/g.11321 Transcript_3039/m.11321 type:complete len:257 (-) Transcript_3039:116-886(-)